MADEQEYDPSELAAQELYHQLVSLSEDDGHRDVMVTLRLPPTGAHVGDVWLSLRDVQRLSIGARAVSEIQQDAEPEELEPMPPRITDDDTAEVITGFTALLAASDPGTTP